MTPELTSCRYCGDSFFVHKNGLCGSCSWADKKEEEDDAANYEKGYKAGLLLAAEIVDGWHITKGGYGVLAEAIRAEAKADQ